MSSLKAAKSRRTEAIGMISGPATPGPASAVVGEIVALEPDGSIFVDYPGNCLGDVKASTLIEELFIGQRVLLVFERGIPNLPIILGIVHERARIGASTIRLKADTIILEAKHELALQCAESGIHADRNGTLHVKGRNIISRASRTNKVRGATVQIN